jgi:hypothetical protein
MIPMPTLLRLRKAADKAGIPEFHEAVHLLTELSARDSQKTSDMERVYTSIDVIRGQLLEALTRIRGEDEGRK